jgi:hypothetical protein
MKPVVIIAGALHEIERLRAEARRQSRDVAEMLPTSPQNAGTKKGPGSFEPGPWYYLE